MPYRQSLGMGGSAALGGSCGGSEEYDKGLVQKMVLTILKCVALTTREARYGQNHPHEFEILLLMHRISDVRCMLRMDAQFVFDLRLPSKYHKIMKMNFLYV